MSLKTVAIYIYLVLDDWTYKENHQGDFGSDLQDADPFHTKSGIVQNEGPQESKNHPWFIHVYTKWKFSHQEKVN